MTRNRISVSALLLVVLALMAGCLYSLSHYATRTSAAFVTHDGSGRGRGNEHRGGGQGNGGVGGLPLTPSVGSVSATPGRPPHAHVVVKDGAFGPSLLSVPVGAVVTWQNIGSDVCTLAGRAEPLLPGLVPHVQPGNTWTLHFHQAGTYLYGCDESRGSDTPADIVVDLTATAVESGTASATSPAGPSPTDTASPSDTASLTVSTTP